MNLLSGSVLRLNYHTFGAPQINIIWLIQLTYNEAIVYTPGRPDAPQAWGNDTIPTKKCAFVAFLLSNELPRSSLHGDKPPVNGPVQKWVFVTLFDVVINVPHTACVNVATLDNCKVPKFCPNHDSSVPAQPIKLCMPVGATLPCVGKLIGCTHSVKKSCDTNWIWEEKFFSLVFALSF